MTKTWNLGDEFWRGRFDISLEFVTCPTCAGDKTVILVDGFGVEHVLPCRGCSPGYNAPSGLVHQYSWVGKAKRDTVRQTEEAGDEVKYNHGLSPEEMYDTSEEALAASIPLREAHELEQAERLARGQSSSKRDMTWSLHYWGGERRRLEKALAYANARLGTIRGTPEADRKGQLPAGAK